MNLCMNYVPFQSMIILFWLIMLVVLWLTLTCYIYLPVFILIKFCTFIKLRDSRQSHCQITKWFLRHFALQRSKCNPVAGVVSSWSGCIHTKSWYHKIVSLIRGSLSGMCSIFVMQAWTFSFAELHHILSWCYQRHCGIFTFSLFLSCFSTRLYFYFILSKKLRVEVWDIFLLLMLIYRASTRQHKQIFLEMWNINGSYKVSAFFQ